MTNDHTISDELLTAAIQSVRGMGYNPEPQKILQVRMDALVGAPCATCRHYGVEHLIDLGPFKFCLGLGCACGRRALRALARTLRPFWAIFLAGAYFAAHLAFWAFQGFPVAR